MKAARLLFAACAILALASCGDRHRQSAEEALRKMGGSALRREAAFFYKQLFVAPAGQFSLPKLNHCPPTFRKFQPLHVGAYADGFSLAISSARGVEEGLYIVPLDMDHTPRRGPNASFQRIEDGIYWYSFRP